MAGNKMLTDLGWGDINAAEHSFGYGTQELQPDGTYSELKPHDEHKFAKVTPMLHHGGRVLRQQFKDAGYVVKMPPPGGKYDIIDPNDKDEAGNGKVKFKLLPMLHPASEATSGAPKPKAPKPPQVVEVDAEGNPIKKTRAPRAKADATASGKVAAASSEPAPEADLPEDE